MARVASYCTLKSFSFCWPSWILSSSSLLKYSFWSSPLILYISKNYLFNYLETAIRGFNPPSLTNCDIISSIKIYDFLKIIIILPSTIRLLKILITINWICGFGFSSLAKRFIKNLKIWKSKTNFFLLWTNELRLFYKEKMINY